MLDFADKYKIEKQVRKFFSNMESNLILQIMNNNILPLKFQHLFIISYIPPKDSQIRTHT